MDKIIQKLSSRKLWLAISGVAVGVATILGVDGSDITTVAGALTALVSAVSYIVMEGKIDAERIKNAIVEVEDVTELIKGAEISE